MAFKIKLKNKNSMWTCRVDILPNHQPWCALRGQKKKKFILQGAILKRKFCRGVLQNSPILQGITTI
jgi:hypothetical protein